MSYSFAALCADYEADLARMVITRTREVDETAERLLKYVDKYQAVTARDGVPAVFIGPSFEREASSNFRDNPAQGDPLDRVSRNVPRGMGPYTGPNAWVNAAVDAYHLDGLDKIGANRWTWPQLCYSGEKFNGFGPRMHGRKTGYLWAGTNIYDGGKYVADGRWDAGAEDTQLGIIPMAKRMVQINPALDMAGAIISAAIANPPPAAPDSEPTNLESVSALQSDLNRLGSHLDVDGSMGALTHRAVRAFQRAHGLEVDGIPGHDTWAAIHAALMLPAEQRADVVAKIVEQPEHQGPTFAEAVAAFFAHLKAEIEGAANG